MLLPSHHFDVQLTPPGLGSHAPAAELVVGEELVQLASVPPNPSIEDPATKFEYGPCAPFPKLIRFAVSNEAFWTPIDWAFASTLARNSSARILVGITTSARSGAFHAQEFTSTKWPTNASGDDSAQTQCEQA
jgi:hypothetical protein